MAAAVTTARLAGAAEVDRALGHAAVSARFGEGDLASILDHQRPHRDRPGQPGRGGPLAGPGHRELGSAGHGR